MEPRLIGVTGGIAAGKTTVTGLLLKLGCAVIDADLLAREVTATGSAALDQIAATFGDEVIADDGSLDRARLAQIVFDDPAARRKLEAITHPAIASAARQRAADLGAQGHQVVFYEAALLVETGRHSDLDGLVVVTAGEAQRVERLMARSGLTYEEAQKRLAAQLPQDVKVQVADFVIDNSGALEQTRAQVEALWEQLSGARHRSP
jgi:dephospho-CoA kinase